MSDPADDPQANDSHWRAMRRVAMGLTLVWALLTFAPPFFARQLAFEIAGAPAIVWIAAQFGPFAYVVLAWLYERRASRLEQQRGDRAG